MTMPPDEADASKDVLLELKRLYFQSVPTKQIPFDRLLSGVRPAWEFQDRFYNTVVSKDATAYHPSAVYVRWFLKLFIDSLQRRLAELEDEVCEM